jgi:thiamine biosynthesis protein ThiS
MRNEIEITFNGITEKVSPGTTVADLIARSEENDKNLIVERNNRFVHPHAYASTLVGHGDRIELINPDFGG